MRVTDNPTADVLPVFSPDGKQLLWTSNRTPEHTSQLFLGEFKLPEGGLGECSVELRHSRIMALSGWLDGFDFQLAQHLRDGKKAQKADASFKLDVASFRWPAPMPPRPRVPSSPIHSFVIQASVHM